MLFTQLAEAITLVFVRLNHYPGGWAAESNGNKADIRPTEAGAGQSWAKNLQTVGSQVEDRTKVSRTKFWLLYYI